MWIKKKAGQMKSPVSTIVFEFYIKEPRDRNYAESGPVFLTSLTEAKLKNRKHGFESSQDANSLDLILVTS